MTEDLSLHEIASPHILRRAEWELDSSDQRGTST